MSKHNRKNTLLLKEEESSLSQTEKQLDKLLRNASLLAILTTEMRY